MIDLGDRRIHDDGTVVLTPNAAMEALYAGRSLDGAVVEPCEDATLHNDSNRLLDLGMTQLLVIDGPIHGHRDWYGDWITPEPYASMDVLAHCIARCDTDEQMERVCEEYQLFEQRDMLPVLRHLIYMVDRLRGSGVTWGVGRGSSVSSFMLYLIGINRINPLEFGLDINEFLK